MLSHASLVDGACCPMPGPQRPFVNPGMPPGRPEAARFAPPVPRPKLNLPITLSRRDTSRFEELESIIDKKFTARI